MQSHYDVLGVDPSASREEIRHAYRQLVRSLHPDRHASLTDETHAVLTRRLVAVTDAWRVLGDDDKRALYDQVWQAAARRALLVAGGRLIPSSAGPAPAPGSEAAVLRRTAPGWAAPREAGARQQACPGATSGRVPADVPAADAAGAFGPAAARWGGTWSPGSAPVDRPAGIQRPGADAAGFAATGAAGAPGPRPASPGGARRSWRSRRADECRLCGSAPAVAVDLRAQRSGLLRTLFTGGGPVERGPLCRSCGLAVLRDLTDVALCGGQPTGTFGSRSNRRTLAGDLLALGWLRNLFTVLGNLSFWLPLRRLRPPVRDPQVRAPLEHPLDPGRTLWSRRGGQVASAVLVAAATVAVLWLAVVLIAGHGPLPGS